MSSNDVPPPSTSASNTGKAPVVCVFCGSSPGTSPKHLEAARALAHVFAEHKITLVYGAGTKGIMGEIGRTLVSLSGPDSVHGFIPEPLVGFEKEKGPDTTESSNNMSKADTAMYGRTTVVSDMHTRKELMAKEVMEGGPGSGFIALSGGFGTLEELMEIATWNQLGIHKVGVVVFNVNGYYDAILQWVKHAVSAGFISPANEGIIVEATDAEGAVKALREYQPSKDRFNLTWSQK